MQKVALVGNPNTGKTTLFNTITKSLEHVGNWHGVTVDKKEKIFYYKNKQYSLVDLPGTYSLSCYSFEECVTRDFLIQENAIVVNVCDANNLRRNMYLTMQLLEMGICPIICVNMANELAYTKKHIDIKMLSKLLNVPCFLIDAQNKNQVNKFVNFVCNYSLQKSVNIISSYDEKMNSFLQQFNRYFVGESRDFFALKFLEKDDVFIAKSNLSFEEIEMLKYSAQQLKLDEEYVAQIRYKKIDEILNKCTTGFDKIYGYNKADKYILNKWLFVPIFLFVLAIIFFLTFSSVGVFVSTQITSFYSKYIRTFVVKLFSSAISQSYVGIFFNEAILGGIESVIGFLPQIVLLYFFLNLLEDSGYISRLAFYLDDFLSSFGLSGKMIFSILMGFGCCATACSTCKSFENQNSKIKVAMLSPYMSCSAKLPIYLLVCTAFFSGYLFLIVSFLYLLSVFVALIVSYAFNKRCLKISGQTFLMEFPPYRVPNFRRIFRLVVANVKSFITRVGSVIIVFSGIIWIMQNCNLSLKYISTNQTTESILAHICSFLSPIFKPLGFEGYGVVCALVTGFVAKEMIVSSFKIINNLGNASFYELALSITLLSNPIHFSSASALSFVVFSLLYCPCLSTLSVMSKEIGLKWTCISVVVQFVVAYVISFVVYNIALCGWWVVFAIIVLLFLVFVLPKVYKSIKKPQTSPYKAHTLAIY